VALTEDQQLLISLGNDEDLKKRRKEEWSKLAHNYTSLPQAYMTCIGFPPPDTITSDAIHI
jgi:hypothetical protein